MKVFISYSGSKSRMLAEAASRFLSQILPEIGFFRSPSDIAMGSHWLLQIEEAYSSADVAVVCVTRENLDKPWLLYEIGALSANKARVVPLLLDLRPSELSGPIATLKAVSVDKDGMWNLVQILHSLLGDDSPLIEEKRRDFDKTWPAFLASLEVTRHIPIFYGGGDVMNVFRGADLIHFAGHGDFNASNIMVPGNHDVVISGDVVSRKEPSAEAPAAISAEQAFERINAAVRQNLEQLKENVQQAREQSAQFFKLTIGFAAAGFLVILGAVGLLLAGQVSAGVVASVTSLIPEATALLFFRKDAELRRSIEAYNQHILGSQQTLTMIDLCETMKEETERDRMKRDIILRVLDISHDTDRTPSPNKGVQATK